MNITMDLLRISRMIALTDGDLRVNPSEVDLITELLSEIVDHINQIREIAGQETIDE